MFLRICFSFFLSIGIKTKKKFKKNEWEGGDENEKEKKQTMENVQMILTT